MNFRIFISVAVISLSAGSSQLHLIYTADRIASAFGGYFFSLGILPMICGGIIGAVGTTPLNQGIKKAWWLPVLGALSALGPVMLVLWAMSQPGH